jgi:GNAT superfamily N-acetyltransferase
MKISRTKILDETIHREINEFWDSEYPVRLNGRYLTLLDGVENFEHILIRDENGKLMAWTVWFEKEGEIRFSIIVDPRTSGQGLGTILLNELKKELDEFYGWVIDIEGDPKKDGSCYTSPLNFYRKNGFEVLDDVRIDNDIINAVKIRWKK